MDKKIKWVQSISSIGYVFSVIGKVFAILGAVALLLGILLCSLIPAEFISLELESRMDVIVNFRSMMGDDWDPALITENVISGEDVTVTEDGVVVSSLVPIEEINCRSITLMMIPGFVEMTVVAFFLHFLAKALKELRSSPTPFRREVGEPLRIAGIIFIVQSVAPVLCAELIVFLTGSSLLEINWDMGKVFLGFVIIALAAVFDFGCELQSRCESAAPSAPSAPSAPAEPMQEKTASEKKDENDHNPDAF